MKRPARNKNGLSQFILRFAILGATLPAPFPCYAQPESIVSQDFYESFCNLNNWQEFKFTNISTTSTYRIIKLDTSFGNKPSCSNLGLELSSKAGASGLLSNFVFDPHYLHYLDWTWRVIKPLAKRKLTQKSGDDYEIRIYVMFADPKAKQGFLTRLKNEVRNMLSDAPNPKNSLVYVWSQEPFRRCTNSPYTDRVKMIGVRVNTLEWNQTKLDLASDYRECFNEEPPRRARLALMADADNTGTETRSLLASLNLTTIKRSGAD